LLDVKRIPWIFVTALAATGFLLLWLGAHGFPTYTADALPVKQPAIMYLRDGVFSCPNYIGIFPFAELRAMSNPPLYIFANLAAFWMFGVNMFAALAEDLSIHFLLVAIVSWLMLRGTKSQVISGGFAFASLFLMLPVGRPEELAMLFGIAGAAVYGLTRHKWVGALLLGVSGMTSASNAMKAWIAALALDYVASTIDRKWLLRTAGCGALSGVVAAVVWAAYVSPYFSEARAQFSNTRGGSYQPSLIEAVSFPSPTSTSYVVSFVFVMALGWPWIKWALRTGVDEALVRLVKAAMIALPGMMVIDAYLRRPIYDYRFDIMVALAVALCMVAPVFDRLRAAKPPLAVAGLAVVGLIALSPNVLILRYALAPLTWDSQAVTLGAAIDRLKTVIPPDVSIGGDATFWGFAADHPNYVMFYSRRYEQWPDYVLAGTWAEPDNIQQRPDWAEYLNKAYEPVPEATDAYHPGCSLKVLGLRVPISHGTCDFKMRVWRRKTAITRASTGARSE
jgi:hypothetical protein